MKGALLGKGTPRSPETPLQLGGGATLKKQVGGGKEELNKSREGPEEGGSSQGEDADIEAVTPGTTATWWRVRDASH